MVRRIVPWAIGAILTGLYGYALVAPVGNLLYLPQVGFAVTPIGWFWLVLGVALPVVVYAIALWAGRGRSAGRRLTALAAGVAVLALLQLEMLLLVSTSSYFAA